MSDETQPQNGALGRLGKISPFFVLAGLLGGPFGSYILFRQEVTVQVAQLQLQITQHGEKLAALQEKVDKEMVSREVHNTRLEMQKEIDKLKEENERLQVEELRAEMHKR